MNKIKKTKNYKKIQIVLAKTQNFQMKLIKIN